MHLNILNFIQLYIISQLDTYIKINTYIYIYIMTIMWDRKALHCPRSLGFCLVSDLPFIQI